MNIESGRDIIAPGGEVYGNVGQSEESSVRRPHVPDQPESSNNPMQEPSQNIPQQPVAQSTTVQGNSSTFSNVPEQPGPSNTAAMRGVAQSEVPQQQGQGGFVEVVTQSEIKAFGFTVKGIPAIFLGGGFTVALIIAARDPNTRAELVKAFIPLAAGAAASCVVTKISQGSVLVEVVTKGAEAESNLLKSYSSGKILDGLKSYLWRDVDDDVKAKLKVDLITCKVIRASEEDFDAIRKEELSLKGHFFPKDATEIILSSSPVLQDQSKVVTELSASDTKTLLVEEEKDKLVVKVVERQTGDDLKSGEMKISLAEAEADIPSKSLSSLIMTPYLLTRHKESQKLSSSYDRFEMTSYSFASDTKALLVEEEKDKLVKVVERLTGDDLKSEEMKISLAEAEADIPLKSSLSLIIPSPKLTRHKESQKLSSSYDRFEMTSYSFASDTKALLVEEEKDKLVKVVERLTGDDLKSEEMKISFAEAEADIPSKSLSSLIMPSPKLTRHKESQKLSSSYDRFEMPSYSIASDEVLQWELNCFAVVENIKFCSLHDPSRYISLLAEIFKRNNDDLMGKAVQLFPRSLNLSKVEFSWNTTDAFCEILRKQSEEIRSLKLCSCFSDIGRIISAIIEMPGKVQTLDISYNILPGIPPAFFFEKVESVTMQGCFSDETEIEEMKLRGLNRKQDANETQKNIIQKIIDQLPNDSQLEVRLGLDNEHEWIILRPHTQTESSLKHGRPPKHKNRCVCV
ncbi:uncharacterized protein LOC143470017 isoform X2 [Clavelina lepadiformis]